MLTANKPWIKVNNLILSSANKYLSDEPIALNAEVGGLQMH